jgi:hypothetical protein
LKRKLIFLNLLLAGLTIAAGWKLREQYLADQQLTAKVRKNPVKPPPPAPVAATPKPDPFTSVTYADVAQKNLFAKDRNPNVIVDVVAPPPPKKMPPLPILFGVMGLPSGMTALMAEKADAKTHGVHVGDTVGAFKVVAITQQTLSFEWDGKRIDKKVEELVDRPTPPQEAAGPVNAANVAPNAPAPPPDPKKQVTIGENVKACQPGDTSPAGTVVDGYRKIKEPTPFGDACRWIKINQ